MKELFRRGDLVRKKDGDGTAMLVEGYRDGQVLCTFWEGIVRKLAGFPEADLEKIPYHKEA